MKYGSFDSVLRAFLERKDEEYRKQKDPNWWWASELGLCRRKQVLRRTGVPESDEKEWRMRFVMRDGTAYHEWREKAAEEMGVLVKAEGRLIDDKLRYKGRFDLLVNLKNGLSLIDIKSQRSEAFFRRKKLAETKRVNFHQKLQLASYNYFALKEYPNIKEARLYFVDRGGGLREEYIFHFGKAWFAKVLDELNALNKYWKDGKFPPKLLPGSEGKWQCRFCSYKEICKMVDKQKLTINGIKKLAMNAKK